MKHWKKELKNTGSGTKEIELSNGEITETYDE